MFLRRVCNINGQAFLQSKTNQINISEQESECKWWNDTLKRNKRICIDLSFIGFILLHKARNDRETVLNLRMFHQFITACCLLAESFISVRITNVLHRWVYDCVEPEFLQRFSAPYHSVNREDDLRKPYSTYICTSPPWMAQEFNNNTKVLQSRRMLP